jgi:hypothetical protein
MNGMIKKDKQIELDYYRDLVIATLDYCIDSPDFLIQTSDFDSKKHFESCKLQTVDYYNKGRLSILKQWFRDLTEPMREGRDFEFIKYIKERTGHQIDLFADFDTRIQKIVDSKKIKTANEYRDILSKVDYLCQFESDKQHEIDLLNSLLIDFDSIMTEKQIKNAH